MNKKTENTKLKLFNAYCDMAESQDTAGITASALCRKAGVNRTTFYRYYSIPSDVVDEFAERFVDETYEQVHEKNVDLAELLRIMCSGFAGKAKGQQANRLFSVASFDSLLTRFLTKLSGGPEFRRSASLYFLTGGLNSLMKHWLSQEPDLPVDQVVELMLTYTRCFETCIAEERRNRTS